MILHSTNSTPKKNTQAYANNASLNFSAVKPIIDANLGITSKQQISCWSLECELICIKRNRGTCIVIWTA